MLQSNYYLSPTNFLENNLAVIAERKMLVTRNLKNQMENLQKNASSLSWAKIAAVTVVALAMILGISSSTLGTCVGLCAMIPLAIMRRLRAEQPSIQHYIDQEKKILNTIFENMIKVVKGLSAHKNGTWRAYIEKINNLSAEKKKTIQAFNQSSYLHQLCSQFALNFFDKYQEKLKNEKKEGVKFVEIYSELESSLIRSKFAEEERILIKGVMEFIFENRFHYSKETGNYIKILAESDLKAEVIEEKWQELKRVCKEYTTPPPSLYTK